MERKNVYQQTMTSCNNLDFASIVGFFLLQTIIFFRVYFYCYALRTIYYLLLILPNRWSNIEIYNELHKVFLMLLTAEHFFFFSRCLATIQQQRLEIWNKKKTLREMNFMVFLQWVLLTSFSSNSFFFANKKRNRN